MGKIRFFAGALCAFAYLATCGGGEGRQGGSDQRDAAVGGLDLNHAEAAAAIDVNQPETAAAPPGFVAVACDKSSTRTITSTSGTISVSIQQITYYTSISQSGLNPKAPPIVRVVSCQEDLESVSPPTVGTTIVHSGDPAPETTGPCYEGTATFGMGVIVVTCGASSTSTTTSGSTTTTTPTTTNRYRQVYVSVGA